jgi:hypothetical protein
MYELESLRSERLLDMSNSASYPHMDGDGRKDWLRELIRVIHQETRNTQEEEEKYFSFNKVPLGISGIKRAFQESFADGLYHHEIGDSETGITERNGSVPRPWRV